MPRTTVQRWGDGHGLKLPKRVLDRAGLVVGDEVDVHIRNGQILVSKAGRPGPELAAIVARIPEGMRVGEEGFGEPVGREIW